jgi:hypothetical protein
MPSFALDLPTSGDGSIGLVLWSTSCSATSCVRKHHIPHHDVLMQ